MQHIKIEVDAQGRVVITVEGIKGPTCAEATKNIQKALGPVLNMHNTYEFYETESSQCNSISH